MWTLRHSLVVPALLAGSLLHAQPPGALIDGILAVVGNERVLFSDLANRLEQARQAGERIEDGMICGELEDILFEKLLLDQARLDSVVVDEGQVQSELERRVAFFARQIGGNEELEKFYGKSIAEIKDDFHDQVADQLLVQTMQGKVTGEVKVTPRDVERFYREIPEDSLPLVNAEVEFAQIVRRPKPDEEEDRRVRQKVEEMRRAVINGEKDICVLIMLYSEDPGSRNGCGELGMVPRGVMVPEFDAVALSLKDGEVSQVFKTQYGYHFMQMIERRGEQYNARHLLMKPKVSAADLERERVLLDSLAREIAEGRLDFGKLAAELSEDEESRSNSGRVLEPSSNSYRWPMGQLERETAFALNTLDPGGVSLPQLVTLPDDSREYRLLELQVRTDPHVANLKDDYPMILQAAEARKRTDAVDRWVKDKLAGTYVRLMKGYGTCTFTHPWVAIDEP